MTILYIFSILTLLILITGLVIMAIGGKLNSKYGNKIMALRVLFQAITILFLVAIYYYSK